jgi:hypothetical protein
VRKISCDKCDGGIITTHDPKDPPGINTYTICDDCKGNGWYWYAKGLLVLIIPSFLLFGGALCR